MFVSLVLVLLFLFQAAFQALLAAGKAWGAIAYGGSHQGILPVRLRTLSAVVSFVYVAFAVIFTFEALNASLLSDSVRQNLLWFLLILFTVGTVMNTISPSRPERYWALYTLVTAGCAAMLLFT